MHESGENYLETILLLKARLGSVRSIDVADELGYSKASISRALGILREDAYVYVDDKGNIEFTPKGREKAEAIYERHCLISQFLEKTLGLDPKIAEHDACRIEHIISPETFDKIKIFMAARED